MLTGGVTRISTSSGGTEANLAGNDPSISADGRFIAFSSLSTNLIASDTNGDWDVYIKDTLTGTTQRV